MSDIQVENFIMDIERRGEYKIFVGYKKINHNQLINII